MIDYFLKFASESEAIEMLGAEGAVNEDGEIITASHDFAICVVGPIYKPTGKMLKDGEGVDYPETAPIPGFHVNIRMINGALPASLEPYAVTPDSPVCVFGGGVIHV